MTPLTFRISRGLGAALLIAALACLCPDSRVLAAAAPTAEKSPKNAEKSPKDAEKSSKEAEAKVAAAVAKVFDTSKLHKIEITLAPEDVPTIAKFLDVRLKCTFKIDGKELKDVGIRQSGGPYHPYIPLASKPTFSIKFNDFVKGQDLYGLEKLVLKNGLQDMSWVNEHMTYEVFRRAGLAAPMTAHAHVIVNGIDLGLYLMREPVNKQFLTRNFGKDYNDGNLYEIGEELLFEFANAPMRTDLKDEKEDGRKRDDILRLAAVASVVPQEYFLQAVTPLLDVDRYLTYMAVEGVASVLDGFSFHDNNSFLYNNPKDGKFVVLPYGADEAFYGSTVRLTSPLQPPFSVLASRVQAVPGLMEKYKAEIARVSGPAIWNKPALLARVAEVGQILDAAEKTPRLNSDIARFKSYRPGIEKFINDAGTMPGMPKG